MRTRHSRLASIALMVALLATVVDASGTITTSYSYGPYGATTTGGTASANPSAFTGRELDPTGLYFYRARYYEPGTGRFLSEDPLGLAAGDANPYRYLGNDPLNGTDPSGLCGDCVIDLAFIGADLFSIATGSRKERDAAWLALGLDVLGLFVPFAVGLGHADDVLRLGDEGLSWLDEVAGAACSFPPDTEVTTPSGPVAIAAIEPGDEVLAYDPAAGTASARRVSAVSVHADEEIATVLVDGERIVATPDHPFLTAGRGWVAAGELRPGETIRRLDGTTGTVFAVVVASRDSQMWDLTVEGLHTFAVGAGGWIVHNCLTPPKVPKNPADAPGPEWVWRSTGDQPGSPNGAWTRPGTQEYLRWDPNEKTHGPHWDWRDANGNTWRIFPDGAVRLK